MGSISTVQVTTRTQDNIQLHKQKDIHVQAKLHIDTDDWLAYFGNHFNNYFGNYETPFEETSIKDTTDGCNVTFTAAEETPLNCNIPVGRNGESCVPWTYHRKGYDNRISWVRFQNNEVLVGEHGLFTDLSHSNFCRNPDRDREGAWCYTSLSYEYAYCQMPPNCKKVTDIHPTDTGRCVNSDCTVLRNDWFF